jgi:hypothetical protein
VIGLNSSSEGNHDAPDVQTTNLVICGTRSTLGLFFDTVATIEQGNDKFWQEHTFVVVVSNNCNSFYNIKNQEENAQATSALTIEL